MNDLITKSYSPKTFRKEAHQLADLLADQLELAQGPVIERTINWETPEDQLAYWQNDFESPLTTDPTDLFRSVISRSNNLHSRGYMGHQAPPPYSYTMTLRHSLANTSCRVTEIIPPAVQTALAGPGLNHGVPLDEFCDTVFTALIRGDKQEIGFGPTENLEGMIAAQQTLFQGSAARFPVETYTY